MKRLFLTALLVFVALLFISAVTPLAAQEVTQEAPPVGAVEPVPAAEPFNFWEWATRNQTTIIAGIFGAILLLRDRQHDKSLKYVLEHAERRSVDAIEAAHESLPETAQAAIDRVLGIAETLIDQSAAVVAFLRRATDGQPNPEPPAPEQG